MTAMIAVSPTGDSKQDERMPFGAFALDDLGLVPPDAGHSFEDYERAFNGSQTILSQMAIVQGDLLNACERAFGDDYLQLLDGASAHTAANRKAVMKSTPRSIRHKDLTFSHYRVLASRWVGEKKRKDFLDLAVQFGWTPADLEDRRAELWEFRYGDLPYTPANARDPQGALSDWLAGGREAAEDMAARGPAKPRLTACLAELRRIARLEYTIGRDVFSLERLLVFLDEMALIVKEL